MNAQPRQFTDEPATRRGHFMPLIIGITGSSHAGKTWSALRLATGIQRVTGGEIFGVDTESDRMRHYSDYFTFRHVPLDPPHSSLDYRGAIDHCIARGAKIIIIDQMSSEHDGEGGVLDQMDDFLERVAGDDMGKREKNLSRALIVPKRQQKSLTRHIVTLGKKTTFIILYRAEPKVKPRKGGVDDLGWQPVTTSTLPYEMTVRFLLAPGSDGVPTLMPATPAEKLSTKNPEQFRGWFNQGDQLSEDMGQRLATWAAGGSGADPFEALIPAYEECKSLDAFEKLEAERAKIWARTSPCKGKLKSIRDAILQRLHLPSQERQAEAQRAAALLIPSTPINDPDNGSWIRHLRKSETLEALELIFQNCVKVHDACKLGLPLEIEDAYNIRREYLLEQEGKAE
jgi:hypothetical protein